MAEIVRPYVLINEEYFKAYSPIPENYSIEELLPFFPVAEDLWVKDLIGAPLYNELLEQVNENNVTELNSTLLLRLYPYLSYCIVYEALPFISYHLSSVGITKGKSENSDSVSINDVNFISSSIRKTIEEMKKMLRKFLEDHADLYPLYKSDGNGCECTHTEDNHLIWDFIIGSGSYDKYEMQKMVFARNASRRAPNPRCQLYATGRQSINLG